MTFPFYTGQQTFSANSAEAQWVEESFSAFGTLRSLLPEGFAAYARIFHPAYLNRDEERPVRWPSGRDVLSIR